MNLMQKCHRKIPLQNDTTKCQPKMSVQNFYDVKYIEMPVKISAHRNQNIRFARALSVISLCHF